MRKPMEYMGVKIPYFDTIEGRAAYLSRKDVGYEKMPGNGSGHNKWHNPEHVRLAEEYGITMPQKFATEGAQLKPGIINFGTSPAPKTWATACMQIIWLQQEIEKCQREAALKAASATDPQQMREREAYMKIYGYSRNDQGEWINAEHQALAKATSLPFLIVDYNANRSSAEKISMPNRPGVVTGLEDSTKWDAIRQDVETSMTLAVLVDADERSTVQKSLAWHARRVGGEWRKKAKRQAASGQPVDAAPASVQQAMALNIAIPHGGDSAQRKAALQKATRTLFDA